MTGFVWSRDGEDYVDTVHAAGCGHLRLAEADPGRTPHALAATTLDAALAEVADAMGWHDYPDGESGAAFDLRAAPCTRR